MNLYPYTVFKFKMFFADTYDHQERYVVAESEEAAISKFEAYIEALGNNGFMKPTSWTYPVVEIDYVI